MLASALYQTIDGIFVGQFLGATAFAALNLAMPFVIINFSLADLIGVGSAVPISICLGREQEGEANNIFYLCLPHDRGHQRGSRRHPVCGGPASHADHGGPKGNLPGWRSNICRCMPFAPR